MKKFNLLITLFACLHLFSQQNGVNLKYEVLDQNYAGKIFRNTARLANKPTGSPYLNNMFEVASVGNVSQKAIMRYNVFADEFEFITTKKDTLILDKIEDFGEIIFTNTNKKFKLIAHTNNKNKLLFGYLLELYSNINIILYKKDTVYFTDEKPAKTTLEQNKPAKFTLNSPFYFIKYNDKMPSEFPENKKSLLKLFPEKRTEIEVFFKENKINFATENDLKKIVDLLARL